MTRKVLQKLAAHGLNAMNIDMKGEDEAVKRYCTADINVVWRNAACAKAYGVWIELTTLVIPGVNDTEGELSRIARRINSDLGDNTPWHLTRYCPAYKFRGESYVPPTPLSTLEKARSIGIVEGLKFVYLG
ncbi:MAG: AmmeMemoRadiSam system radical SAM enzyme, partial [Nitrososphaeria archaeon]|nr:AmmeMemoRadiSam system radical SAM enzyme [Nitrososphaeria archaeon]